MLGCQDFCGYYDWTFHFARRSWGQQAVRQFWAEAIGGEAQQHYAQSASRAGLRGLYQQWTKTGVEESCDWTFTLDEARNVLRFDMRQCPSKGFLLANDLQADEDYCDHCMGWTVPLLSGVGVELDRARAQSLRPMLGYDAQQRPSHATAGGGGRHSARRAMELRLSAPLAIRSAAAVAAVREPVERPLRRAGRLVRSGQRARDLRAGIRRAGGLPQPGSRLRLLTIGKIYADGRQCPIDPSAVLLGGERDELAGVAARFQATAAKRRPLILHHFLPRGPMLDFASAGLPRPVPMLPLLIRRGLYRHQPGGPTPDLTELLMLLAAALQKPIP